MGIEKYITPSSSSRKRKIKLPSSCSKELYVSCLAELQETRRQESVLPFALLQEIIMVEVIQGLLPNH